ncbi:MAG: ABC transporter permease [Anaerolineae bacterium]|nr:ABC transporter permease [Anaerolineae bacterium]NIQ81644.1 ABC transporter permease [Anaerolineae bacterium]
MAVQARAVRVSKAPGLNWRDILITVLMLLVGGGILVLGAFGTQAGDQATFTDDMLGTLFSLSSQPTLYAIGVLCLFAAGMRLYRGLAALRAWLTLALAVLAAFAFLVWMTSGTTLNLPGMIQATLIAATPLTLGAMCGLLSERSGIINIAIEGMMLFGAFAGVAFAALFDNLWVGLIAASLIGGVMAGLHAVLSIEYKVDQIVSGTVINILAVGASRFLNLRVLEPAGLSTPGHFDTIPIPLLADIPIVGPILFDNQPTTYIMLVLLVAVNYVVFFTPWGLRMRACGEHPRAADTVGVHVNRMRYISVIIGGLIAGVGGAYFSLGQVGTFEDAMTRGQGFVALAAMIFGNWNPIGGFIAALLFGFANALQVKMQILQPVLPFVNVTIPPEFLQMAPYILTIIVVAGVVGRVRPPAQEGKPYEKQ